MVRERSVTPEGKGSAQGTGLPGEPVVGSPSGSGKSTLMHCLAGLDQPSGGTVTVAGTDLGSLDDDALTIFRREHIGFARPPARRAVRRPAAASPLAVTRRRRPHRRPCRTPRRCSPGTPGRPGDSGRRAIPRLMRTWGFSGLPDLVASRRPPVVARWSLFGRGTDTRWIITRGLPARQLQALDRRPS
ncbi:ATP-binding cassette domain-containing protein [Nonomuraea sp. NPDC003727]